MANMKNMSNLAEKIITTQVSPKEFQHVLYIVEDWDQIAAQYQYELFMWSHAGPDGHEVDIVGVNDIMNALKSLNLTFATTGESPGIVDELKLKEYLPHGVIRDKILDLT